MSFCFPLRQLGGVRMSQNEEVFTAEERHELAVEAVNRLIADAEAKSLLENKELTETIVACIGEEGERHYRPPGRLPPSEEIETIEPPPSHMSSHHTATHHSYLTSIF